MEMNKTLVIIVTYNGIKWIKKCLNSIMTSTIPLHTFIIDNGSTDGTIEYIKKNFSSVKLYLSENNLGFGKANNIGLQYALENQYEYVYLLNQDAWLKPDTIEKLIAIQKKHTDYGILSPFQLQANENNFDNHFGSGVCSWYSNKNILQDLYFNRVKEVYPVSFVMAAHWLISIDCLKKVGGFSPTFPHYGEDNNYIDRAVYNNIQVGIVPRSHAIHDREDRILTKKNILYMSYIKRLILISNINNETTYSLPKIILSSFKETIKYKSILPLYYLLKIVTNINTIANNKKKSKNQCAFLNI